MASNESSPTHSIRYDLAVVIATYERSEMLRGTIGELARQRTLPGRVVVVDQGTDEAGAEALVPLARLGTRCVYERSRYRSISAARNIGLEHSRPARIVLYIDDDVELESDIVAEHSRYYDSDADTAAVAGHVTCEAISEEFSRLNTFRPQGKYVASGRGCHMSFRADVLRGIGGFNAYICNSGDETELFGRLGKAGYKVCNGERAVVKHLVCPRGGNRQVGLQSHANYGRVLRDGMVRIVKDRGLATGLLWPIKNWKTVAGLMQTSPTFWKAAAAAGRELYWGMRLARLSRARRDYVPISLELSTGRGIDPGTGLPVV